MISLLSAESYRGNVISLLDVSPDTQSSYTVGEGDIVVFSFPNEEPFIDGVEIRVEIPPSYRAPPGAFGLLIFTNTERPLQSGLLDLEGTRTGLIPLTDRRQQFIRIPLKERSSDSSGADSVVTYFNAIPGEAAGAIQLVPLMKGMPAEAMNQEVSVTFQPILAPVGGLYVQLVSDTEVKEVSLSVDGISMEPEEVVELEPGIYHVELRAEGFLDVNENVGIEAGRVSRIALPLEPPMAEVRFSAPSNAEIFVDGRRTPLGSTSLSLEPGEHTMLIRVGDFSVSRKVFLSPEEEYEIGVELDFFVRTD